MVKTIQENPTITDQIVFDILTPDADGCFLSDPFKVINVRIYYIERSFVSSSQGEYENAVVPTDLQAQYEEAKANACDDPTPENLVKVQKLQEAVDQNSVKNKFYFNTADVIQVFGTEDNPAWLSSDTANAILTKVEEDSSGNPLFGHFQLEWMPLAQREGDYFICWTWTPLPAGDSLSAHNYFKLSGDTNLTTAIPTHQTNPNKYPTLLDRYTADMFKTFMSETDLSPKVLRGLNNSVADGFKLLEDLGNQMIDLFDANVVAEGFLPLLGNLFNLRLRSNDPTQWRRQIKQAIPTFKRKGTLGGLEEVFSQAGIQLKKFTMLWQIISPYTFQELFNVTDEEEFILSKSILLPVDIANFEIYYREAGSDDWITLTSDYVTFTVVDGESIMTWVGDELSFDPVSISSGDSIRIVYEIVNVPGPQQTRENYIRTLPLADLRDEREIDYPLKNWNVRVIEEDDPLFNLVIPQRHPFKESLIYGKIRTEFPYSENIYNMDEYNGSLRDSKEPCHIDKDFLDPCSSCQGSMYTVDVEIEELTNDRLVETFDILEEFVPFHAQNHSINFSGLINDFVKPPEENIEMFITMTGEEFVLGGNGANTIFNRVMLPSTLINRDELATVATVAAAATGTAYNNEISLFSPDKKLSEEGVTTNSFLEVLSPSPNAGEYLLDNVSGHYARISGGDVISEPINQSQFTFRISNQIFTDGSSDVLQDNYFLFDDAAVNLLDFPIKTQFDVDNDSAYSGGVWVVEIPAYSATYDILNILPNGQLVLADSGDTLPGSDTTGVTYILKDDNGYTIDTQNTGRLFVTSRGRIDVTGLTGPGGAVSDIRNLVKTGDYVLVSGTQYRVEDFVPNEEMQFYIEAYTSGDMVGVPVTAYRRVIDNTIGQFTYRGLTLTTLIDYESSFGIMDGTNAPSNPDDVLDDNRFKRNFLIELNPPDGQYYIIEEIDANDITLIGPSAVYTTLGTSVEFNIYKYTKTGPVEIPARVEPDFPGHTFDFLDRRGNVIIDSEIEDVMAFTASIMNTAARGGETIEHVHQTESVSFNIVYDDGRSEKGKVC